MPNVTMKLNNKLNLDFGIIVLSFLFTKDQRGR